MSAFTPSKYVFPLALVFLLGLSSFICFKPLEKLSLSIVARSLQDGKSITAKGEVYYQVAGGLMVTHFSSPLENVTITNSKGELKIYDPVNNTVLQKQASDFSSENSFFYFFLSGKTQDMGLPGSGYKLKDTRFEDKMVITTWIPPDYMLGEFSKVELVHENYKPIFMAFYDPKGKFSLKIFYTGYQQIGDISLPLTITEFQYLPKNDSIITKRVYSDMKMDAEVNNTYLNYKIPANAKVLK
jgi:outer membrane lipoprotein-sorting protein